MKYFYKQLLIFLAFSLITITLCVGLFYNFVVGHVYNQKQQQLYSYANSIAQSNLSMEDLARGMKLLEEEEIQIAIFDKEDIMTYPTTNFQIKNNIATDVLKKVHNGQKISLRGTKLSNTKADTDEQLIVYYPLMKSQTYDGFIALTAPVSSLDDELATLQKRVWLALLLAVVISIPTSYVFAKAQTRRVQRLRNAARLVTEGDYSAKVSVNHNSQDELDDLMNDFNTMTASLKESQEEVERQESLRRQFLMDVAHEMRTPLTTMSGLIEGLKHNLISESRRERSMQLIENETTRLIRLVNDNLDYEKIRSNEVVLDKQTIDVRNLFQSIVEQLSTLAEEKHDQLHYDCPLDYTIYADLDRFKQIVINIVKNSIQFTDSGHIFLMARDEEDYSVVAISDTGIGINEKELNSIWERFYKVDVSRKNTKYGESGIGLSIVQSLVEKHEGTIEVKSKEGEGTTFTIRLPHRELLEKQ